MPNNRVLSIATGLILIILTSWSTGVLGADQNEALYVAATQGDLETVRQLLDSGTAVDGKNAAGWTALMKASMEGHQPVVEELIKQGADVNIQGRAGWTALRRGALVNVANPAPWLFWATVGGPVLITTWQQSPPAAVAWLSGFYLALVGAKVALAVGLGPVRGAASTRAYRVLVLGSGLVLVAVAGLLAAEALAALGWA